MATPLARTEKFLYIATYNVNTFSTYEYNENSAYGFVNLNFVRGIANPNSLTTSIYNVYSLGTSLSNTTEFVSKQYNVNTLGKGQISWTANYPSGSGNTAGGVQDFMVTGKSGIYNNVTRVVIDFNNDNRIVYFICNK